MPEESTNPGGSRESLSTYEAGKALNSLFDHPDNPESEMDEEPEGEQTEEQDVESAEDLDVEVEEVEAEDATEEQDMSDGEDAEPEDEDASDKPFLEGLVVNGQETSVETEEEARSLAQKGLHYTQEMQQLREEQRTWQEEREQISESLTQKETQYEQALGALEQTFGAVLGDEQPDWHSEEMVRMMQERPKEYAELRAQWDQLGAIQAERQRIARERQEKQQKQFQEWRQQQAEALEQKKPEWTDPTKRQAAVSMMTDYARSQGFSDDELQNVHDHRFLLVLHDAARYREAQATGKETAKKKAKSKTAEPGNGKKVNAGNRKYRKRREALKERGDVRDAGALFNELLKK